MYFYGFFQNEIVLISLGRDDFLLIKSNKVTNLDFLLFINTWSVQDLQLYWIYFRRQKTTEAWEKSSLQTFSVKWKINSFKAALNTIWTMITTLLELF